MNNPDYSPQVKQWEVESQMNRYNFNVAQTKAMHEGNRSRYLADPNIGMSPLDAYIAANGSAPPDAEALTQFLIDSGRLGSGTTVTTNGQAFGGGGSGGAINPGGGLSPYYAFISAGGKQEDWDFTTGQPKVTPNASFPSTQGGGGAFSPTANTNPTAYAAFQNYTPDFHAPTGPRSANANGGWRED